MYVRVQSTRKGGRTSRAARNQFWETPTCLIVNSERWGILQQGSRSRFVLHRAVPGAFLQQFCHASEEGAGVFEMQNTFGHVFHNPRPLLATWHLKKKKNESAFGSGRAQRETILGEQQQQLLRQPAGDCCGVWCFKGLFFISKVIRERVARCSLPPLIIIYCYQGAKQGIFC